MADDPVYQYLKLFLDYAPAWVFLVVGILIWLSRKPQIFSEIAKYVSSAKIGEFEIELREVKAQLAETETQLVELEEENLRLNQLYADFDAHAPTQNLAPTRQELRTLAGNLTNLSPVLSALEPGSSHQEIYAAAEILRQRRDFSAFDTLINAVDRIASSENLEDIRYHTVWTLASAVHRTVLAAVKHSKKRSFPKSNWRTRSARCANFTTIRMCSMIDQRHQNRVSADQRHMHWIGSQRVWQNLRAAQTKRGETR